MVKNTQTYKRKSGGWCEKYISYHISAVYPAGHLQGAGSSQSPSTGKKEP